MVEVPWMSKLLGRPVFNPAKGAERGADLISFIGNAARMAQGNLTSAEQAELMRRQAETGGRLHEAATSAWEEMRKAPSALKEKLASLPEPTGDETVDNWHKDTRTNAEAARMIAETYGIPTYALEGSATRENTDAYTQRYEGMEFGEKLGANAGVTAAGYGLDITNAALAGWNTLSGGRLGEEGGKASSIFRAANFLQNAGSGLTAQAYSSMRESANWLEKLILDLEKTGVEQVLDRTLGAGNGLVPMGIRVFGSGAQESEDRGEDWKKQAGTGLARAAIELGTEALSGVGGSWRGTGYGESFLNAVDKWVASKTGSELLGTLANAYGGEALEEMIADVLNPLADRIFGIGEATGRGQDHTFMQQLGDFLTDVWGDGQILYDGLLGGLAGAGGGVTAHVGYSAGARNLAVDISTYKAAQRIAGSNSLKAKFEKLTGVKLDADKETATIQLAAYLTNVTESSGGTLDARQAENNLFNGKTTGTEKNSAQLATAGGRVSDVQGTISSDFKAAGIELHEDESKVLASGFMTGNTDLDTYEEGILEAYKLGQSGKFTLEEAIRGSKYAAVLNESQFRHAWQLGASVQTTENETADIKTEAGRTRVSAALASLGKYADTAVDAYENGQDVSTYAAAMQKAAVLYAANGADLKAAAQEVREGKRADIIGRLTDKQVDAAAQIGQQMRQESDEAARNVGAVYAAIRQQAAAIGAGAAQNTARISAAVRRANAIGSTAMETFKAQREALEAMLQANPELEGSEEFNRLFDEAKRNMETVQRMQRAVENLKSKQTKAEEEQRRTTEHKAGTVSYEAESGSVGGVQYEAVDRSKLTQTQQAVTRIAEAIARATGLEIHIAKFGDNVGGEYLRGQGGVIWLNIDANYKGANIAVGSLTHEMTHWLQEYAPEEYQQLKRAVLDEMNRDPARFAQIFGERARIQPDLRPNDITDEMTANACQILFMDEASVQRIVSENRSLGQKILDFFKSILADIKAAFSEIDTSSDFTLYQEVRAAEGAIDQMRDLFVQAMHTATENLQAERTVQEAEQMTGKNGKASNSAVSEAASVTENTDESSKNTAPEGGAQYQKAERDEILHLKEQVQAHQNELNIMKPVATVNVPTGIDPFNTRAMVKWAQNMLNSYKIVDVPRFGKVKLEPKRIDKSFDYLPTNNSPKKQAELRRAQIAAYPAIPRVLKRGIQIQEHIRHKGNQHDTVTYAAPVVINGVRGNMAVVVTITTYNFYKVHRVLTPDGELLTMDKKIEADSLPSGRPSKEEPITPNMRTASEDIVADADQNSKPQFQMIGEVEETDRLVAVHNKSVSGLKRMLARGGVPFPSIAIKKAGAAHEGFGDVSIVFPRSTIDPAESRWNRLYSNDAWTPTEPRTEYEADEKIATKVKKTVEKLVGSAVYNSLNGSSYLHSSQIERALLDSNGDVFNAFKGLSVVKYAYIKSKGQDVDLPTREKPLDGSYRYKNSELKAVFDEIDGERLATAQWDDAELAEEIASILNRRYEQQLRNSTSRNKDKLLAAIRKTPMYSADNINIGTIRYAYETYQRDGGKFITETDKHELDRVLRNNTAVESDQKYKAWIEQTFHGIVKNEGIPNGKDLYTDSGNLRSFKARHVPATLENIVQQMRKENERGNGLFGVNLRGAATKAYSSVEEMRQDAGKLLGTHVSDDVYDGIMEGFHNRLHEMASAATKYPDRMSSYDTARDVLLETVRDAKSKAAMNRMLQKERDYITYTPELADKLWALRNDVQNMPAPYFEAKPRRIVYPEEALAYILPDNADSSVIKALENKGYNVLTYKAGDEQDRLAKLNSVEGAQFQRWDDTTDDTAAERNGRELAYVRLQSENAILSETVAALRKLTDRQNNTIEKLQKRLQLTKTPEVRENDARKLARQLLAEHGSRADVGSVAAKLKTVGDYILQTPTAEIDEATLKAKARAAAMEILNNAYDQTSLADETYKQIAGEIKGKKLSIDEDFLGELDEAGGYEKFRKSMFGSFTLAKRESHTAETREGYATVDQFYTDLQSEYGKGFFPDVANEGEQVQILAKMLEAGQPIEVNPYAQYMGEASEELANRIVMDAMSGVLRQTEPTTADKQKARRVELQERILALKAENKLEQREAGRLYQETLDLAQSLDNLEKKYVALWVMANARVDQVRAEGRERALEAKAKERAKAAEKLTELKEHYKEIQKNARQRRENTDIRRKIRKTIDELNRRLAKPTASRYVPRELVQRTVDTLKLLDPRPNEYPGYRVLKKDGTLVATLTLNKETTTVRASSEEELYRKIDELWSKHPEIAERKARIGEELTAIRNMYEDYEKNDTYKVVYDEVTEQMLKNVAAAVGNTTIVNMTPAQLETVHDALKSLMHVIDDAVKVRLGNEERSAFEVANTMTQETREIPKAQKGWVKEHYIPAHLRPDVAFKRFAGFKKGSAWESVCRMLNDGQLKQTEITMKLSLPFAELINNESAMRELTGVDRLGHVDKKKLVDIGLKNESGQAIPVTRGIALGIYMDLLNEDNRRHFINTGKTIPNLGDYYGGKGGFGVGTQRAVGIATELSELYHEQREAKDNGDEKRADKLQEQIKTLKQSGESYADTVKETIEQLLTDFDRKWIAATQQLMDRDSKRYLNETTMEVYGIEKARVPHYYPIYTDKNFIASSFESVTRDMNLENVSFMKERVESGNPTLALDISSVVNSQIQRVAQYSGLMPAIRNFNKIWNKGQRGYSDSLKNALRDVFGEAGGKYVENLIADLTGSRSVGDDSLGFNRLMARMRGNLAQTSLTVSPRVALAQAASYPTASAELDAKSLAKAFFRGGRNNHMLSRADKELIAKWSPLLYYRMKGYSSAELGDIQNSQRLSSRLWKKARWATGWIQAVDGATVGRLWYAAEYWVQEHKPDLAKGTDAYYQEVAIKFNDVVEKTQPNYTTMQRPQILRDPNELLRSLTMFMTQRLQNVNIIYDAAGSYQKARADKANGRNGVTNEDVKEARSQLISAVSSQVIQASVYVGFKLFADALLHNMKAYRDDEDGELKLTSISLRLLDNYIDAIAGMFLGGSEIHSIISSIITRSTWSGLSLSGVDSVNDILSDLMTLATTDYDFDDEKDKAKFNKQLSRVGLSFAQCFGAPANNALKIKNALLYHIEDMRNGEFLSFNAGFEPSSDQKAERLIRALESGDEDAIQKTAGVYESEKDAVAAIKNKLKKDVKSGRRTVNDAERLLSQFGIEEDEAYWAALGMVGEDKYTEIKTAAFAGDSSTFKSEMQQLTEHGFKEKDVYDSIEAFAKKVFMGQELTEDEQKIVGDRKFDEATARKLLHSYAGMSVNKAVETVTEWRSNKQFIEKNGWSYSNRKTLYIDGDITKQTLRKALIEYGGMTGEKADATILQYDYEHDTGLVWSERKADFQRGDVTRATMRGYLVKYGSFSNEKAEETLTQWEWQKDVDGAEDISISAIEKYNQYCAAYGIDKSVFAAAYKKCNDTSGDVDEKGESIPYSKIKKVMPQINALALNPTQKTAIALCFWSQSTVNKYKLW